MIDDNENVCISFSVFLRVAAVRHVTEKWILLVHCNPTTSHGHLD